MVSTEGTIITDRFADIGFTLIGAYTSCSAMGPVPTLRRLHIDEDVSELMQKERTSCPNLVLCVDLNVTSATCDATLRHGFDEATHSSCKPHERATFKRWISGGMHDVYRFHNRSASAADYSWHRSERDEQLNIGMRVGGPRHSYGFDAGGYSV